MAMCFVIRKTSPTVVPLALRAISISSARVVLPESHTLHHLHVKTEGSNFHSHQFSTAAVDQKLDKLLKSKIKSMGRSKAQLQNSVIRSTDRNMPPANAMPPADFPFKIEDRAGLITLTRELPGEKIEVFVDLPRVIGIDDDKNSSTDDDDESDNHNDNNSSTDSSDVEEEEKYIANPSLVSVPLQVKIFKKDGSLMKIVILGCADEIIVEQINIRVPCGDADGRQLDVQYEEFDELARDVQYSFKEFIGVRGINKTNVEFLLTKVFWKYVVEIHFLEAFKKFVNSSASSS